MSVRKHIPNAVTTCNLLCGCASIVLASKGMLLWASYVILIGMFFDFMDGLTARALKAHSEIGKQLDSLADMVTFGVAPGFLIYSVLTGAADTVQLWPMDIGVDSAWIPNYANEGPTYWWYIKNIVPLIAFIIPIFAAIRLAKFNVDESQSSEFKGLASPAAALFFIGYAIYFITELGLEAEGIGTWGLNKYFPSAEYVQSFVIGTAGIAVVIASMMLVSTRMFSFKFKTLGWKGNEIRYIFIGIVILSISAALLIKNIFVAAPIIILLYIIISMIYNLIRKKNEVQS